MCTFIYSLNFTYLFIFGLAGSAMLRGLFSSCGKRGLLSGLGTWASHCRSFSRWGTQALASVGSVVVIHRLSCSSSWRIFLNQESNPRLLHWQADSHPLNHQGSPLQLHFLKSKLWGSFFFSSSFPHCLFPLSQSHVNKNIPCCKFLS